MTLLAQLLYFLCFYTVTRACLKDSFALGWGCSLAAVLVALKIWPIQ